DETNPKTRNVVYRASQVGLTLWAIVGLAFAAPTVRRRLAPTLLTAGIIVCFHALTITSVRFHVPLEPLMPIWGAAGFSRLVSAGRADDGRGVVLGRRLGVAQGRLVVRAGLPGRHEQVAGENAPAQDRQ